ncbi:DUF3450 family protein [Pelagicoccus enzymogenes]|uniref:DUF3450 family protein n=1 Tax=Pelagicoccus enzymogenes TaxID=2773457 RepID=UPI00280D59A5|nr:DUF3450 family protein [Pelagicoccus enzymogenes]MDQ8198726.1 DUF3450 family protein [Pelagicoccus enzymogenes]
MLYRNRVSSRLLRFSLGGIALVWGAGVSFGQSSASGVGQLESQTDRWISLQSKIAKVEADWKSEKAMLESSIKLLEAEQATLQENLKANKAASDVFVANRDRIRSRVEERRAGLRTLSTPLDTIESTLRELMPRLPSPLRNEVKAHLSRIDSSDAESVASTPTRVQALVAALSAVDRFSNSLTSARISRPGPSSGEVSVRVLYWGLAGAYGVDDANRRAWVISPGATEWEWEERSDIYDDVFELLKGYESETDSPRMISLPASIEQ